MADPVSTASSIASFVGLADVALRASKELYAFFSALRDARREIRLLSKELKDVSDILSEIRTLASDYDMSLFRAKDRLKIEGLLETLQGCERDVAKMKTKLKPLESGVSGAKVTQVGKSFRWVFTKADFDRFQLEFRNHKESLHIMLSVCGRRNDMQIHELAQSTLRQSQALHTTSRMSVQSSKKALTAIKGLEISNKDGFEAIQASISAETGVMLANTQSIRQGYSAVQQQIMKVSDLMRVKNAQMDKKLEEVVACVNRTSLGDWKQNGWDLQVKQTGVENIILPLLLIEVPLQDMLSTLDSGERQGDPEGGLVNMIWSEFNALLASRHQAAAHRATEQSLVHFGQANVSRMDQESQHGSSRMECLGRERRKICLDGQDDEQILTAPFMRLYNSRCLHRMTPKGLLVVDLGTPPPEAIYQDTSSTIMFFPREGISKTGIIATFARSVRNSRQVRYYSKVYGTQDTGLEIWRADDVEYEFVVITRVPFENSFAICYIGRLTVLPSHRYLRRHIDRLISLDAFSEFTIEHVVARCLVLLDIVRSCLTLYP